MSETTLLYILSTLAQTCAALAAFVGAVGLFRLQLLRAAHNTAERNVRGLAARENLGVGSDLAALLPFDYIITRVNKADEKQGAGSKRALGIWRAFPAAIHRSRKWPIVFEAWNLFLIAVSLVGFNYVSAWADAPWLCGALWFVAVSTFLITVGSVWVWTRGVET